MAVWLYGCVAEYGVRGRATVRWLCGCVRLFGFAALWICGCVDLRAWVNGFVGVRLLWVASVQWLRGCGLVAVKRIGSVDICVWRM